MMFVSSDVTVSSLESSREKKHTTRKKDVLDYPNTDYTQTHVLPRDSKCFFFSNHPTALQYIVRLFMPK